MRQKIKQKAIEIRSKRLGKDVREAMASGVELSGETAADALDMSEATRADWNKKSKDGSFIPKDKWTGTKLGFVYPDGSESVPVELKGEPGSIENATAKEIVMENGSNVEESLMKVLDRPQIWSGSIGVGESITIKGINDYSVLRVYMSGHGILDLVRKNTSSTTSYSGNGFTVTSDNVTLVMGVCVFSISGETLTLRRARAHSMGALADFNNGKEDTMKITAIRGLY